MSEKPRKVDNEPITVDVIKDIIDIYATEGGLSTALYEPEKQFLDDLAAKAERLDKQTTLTSGWRVDCYGFAPFAYDVIVDESGKEIDLEKVLVLLKAVPE